MNTKQGRKMPLQVDNRVSWMDIVAIIGAACSALWVVFGVTADVGDNADAIKLVQGEVVRLEVKVDKQDDETLQAVKDLRGELKEYREEARENNKEVVQKLDRLIERELDNR